MVRYNSYMKVTTNEAFVNKAKIIHNNVYDYSKTSWQGNKTKVTITCPIHGDFEQSPNNHLSGYGCKSCGYENSGKSQALSKASFVEKANFIHSCQYSYEQVNYVNSATKVEILCPVHGSFFMTPSNHTHKTSPQGCPKCGVASRKDLTGWSDTEWEIAGNSSNHFDSFKLYVIQCYNEEERFFKIGKTFRKTSERFRNNATMPYEWCLIKEVTGSAKHICNLERKLHEQLNAYLYKPLTPFGGSKQECFKTSLTEISQIMEAFNGNSSNL